MAGIEFENVSKVYPGDVRAVRELNLTVRDGEFVVLLGPSGCGKSTALRMVAGLERITEGVIRIGDRTVNSVEPRDRDVAMVFQNYALYPHMNVWDNIGFGLRVRGVPKPERATSIDRAAGILGLRGYLKRKPSQLSGGQRQRVAMGRAIVREPKAYLMDEPLSNLDARLRVQMRTEIVRIQRDLGVTTLYVTHDQIEAMTMADRVAVIRGGILQQFDTPDRVYAEPANLFVASFIGSPPMNLAEGMLQERDGRIECLVGARVLPLPAAVVSRRPTLRNAVGRPLAVGIRPEALSLASEGAAATIEGGLVVLESLGFESLAHVEIDARPIVREEVIESMPEVEASEEQLAGMPDEGVKTMFTARLAAGTALEEGETLTLTVDPGRLHFFDLADGRSIG